MSMKIVNLMKEPPAERDLPWLQESLQAAVELELSTLPPYLCGQWTQSPGSKPESLVESIVFNEMSHFGLVCNLLTATGKAPQIFKGYDEIVYPGQLPGGVRPKCDPAFFPCQENFQVVLGFTSYQAFAQMAMMIEYPEDPVPKPVRLGLAETYPSIGEFYDAIQHALNQVKFTYQTGKQLSNDSPSVFVIDGLPKATEAISLIKRQGEGSSRYPYTDPDGTQLSHFYTFGEIYYGKSYVYDKATKTGDWTGTAITIPAALPMTPVPLGGYGPGAPSEVGDCDKIFTTMLQQLDSAWASGSQDDLDNAIGSMIGLQSAGTDLLNQKIARPDGGIYGPQFRKSV